MTSTGFTISSLVFHSLSVRGKSEWVFVELSDANGNTGTSELTGPGARKDVTNALAEMAGRLRGTPITNDTEIAKLLGISNDLFSSNYIQATAISGIRTAVLDALAKKEGATLTQHLGGQHADIVPLYANINRAMLPDNKGQADRSPDLFGKIAALAVNQGFTTIKCAPFDECDPPYYGSGLPDQTKPGLERVRAVREAIGADITLLVDCHSRFNLDSSLALESELDSLGVSWYEEPMNPFAQPEDLASLREAARMPIAGGEMGYGIDVFRKLVENGSLDVVMPDVKYCGGVGEAASIGLELETQNPGSVSLHSPSGPASLLASAHATSVFKGKWPLEPAIEEVPWRAEILEPQELVENGCLVLAPDAGIGAALDKSFLTKYGRSWTP